MSQLDDRVVMEINVWMVRRGWNQTAMAEALDHSQVWISRRLGKRRDVSLSLSEVEGFAKALDVHVDTLLGVGQRRK